MKNKLYRIVAKLISHCDIPLSLYVWYKVAAYLLISPLMQFKDYSPNENFETIIGGSTIVIIIIISFVIACIASKLTSPLFNDIACKITSKITPELELTK